MIMYAGRVRVQCHHVYDPWCIKFPCCVKSIGRELPRCAITTTACISPKSDTIRIDRSTMKILVNEFEFDVQMLCMASLQSIVRSPGLTGCVFFSASLQCFSVSDIGCNQVSVSTPAAVRLQYDIVILEIVACRSGS